MLLIKESFINADTETLFGATPWYRPHTDDRGALFRECQREYGRCTSRVYVDRPTGTVPVGWVFVKRDAYQNTRPGTPPTYLREVWVEVREAPEETEA